MNAGHPPGPVSSPTPLVRLWNRDWEMCHLILPEDVSVTEHGREFTYPVEHVVSQWIFRQNRHTQPAYMTVDEHGQRWSGRLESWAVRKAGDCPHCPHCQQTVMGTEWVPITDL